MSAALLKDPAALASILAPPNGGNPSALQPHQLYPQLLFAQTELNNPAAAAAALASLIPPSFRVSGVANGSSGDQKPSSLEALIEQSVVAQAAAAAAGHGNAKSATDYPMIYEHLTKSLAASTTTTHASSDQGSSSKPSITNGFSSAALQKQQQQIPTSSASALTIESLLYPSRGSGSDNKKGASTPTTTPYQDFVKEEEQLEAIRRTRGGDLMMKMGGFGSRISSQPLQSKQEQIIKQEPMEISHQVSAAKSPEEKTMQELMAEHEQYKSLIEQQAAGLKTRLTDDKLTVLRDHLYKIDKLCTDHSEVIQPSARGFTFKTQLFLALFQLIDILVPVAGQSTAGSGCSDCTGSLGGSNSRRVSTESNRTSTSNGDEEEIVVDDDDDDVQDQIMIQSPTKKIIEDSDQRPEVKPENPTSPKSPKVATSPVLSPKSVTSSPKIPTSPIPASNLTVSGPTASALLPTNTAAAAPITSSSSSASSSCSSSSSSSSSPSPNPVANLHADYMNAITSAISSLSSKSSGSSGSCAGVVRGATGGPVPVHPGLVGVGVGVTPHHHHHHHHHHHSQSNGHHPPVTAGSPN